MELVGSFMLDQEGRYTAVSESLVDLTGYERDEIIGSELDLLFTQGEGGRYERAVKELTKSNGPDVRTIETKLETQEKEEVPVQGNLMLLSGENGDFRGLAGNVRDLTDQKEQQQPLQLICKALEISSVGIALTDENFNFVRTNRSFAVPMGFKPEELIGEPISIMTEVEVVDVPISEQVEKALEGTGEDENVQIRDEITISTPDHGEMVTDLQFTYVQKNVDAPFGVFLVRDITQRKRYEEELRNYESIFRALGNGVYVLGPEGKVLEVNETMLRMAGLDREEALGKSTREFYDEDDYSALVQAISELIENENEDIKRVEATFRPPDKEPFPVEATLTLLPPGEDGEFRGTAGSIRDITHHKEHKRERDRFESLLNVLPDTVVITNLDAVVQETHGFTEWVGYDQTELEGLHINEFIPEEDVEKALSRSEEIFSSETRERATYEVEICTKDGERIPHEVHMTFLPPDEDGYVPGAIHVLRNITEQKKLKKELRRQAFYDDLTGLPNQKLFLNHLKEALERYRRNDLEDEDLFAVVYCDLDRFSRVTEAMGQSAGNELIKAMATRLGDFADPSDIVARAGEDEFALLLTDINDHEHALNRVDRLAEILEQPFVLENKNIFSRASLGVAFPYTGESKEARTLLRNANIARTRSRNEDRPYILFDSDMYEETRQELALEMDLQQSLQNNELEVYYQPIFRIKDQALRGFEALIRWNHPEHGIISPQVFLPLAREIDFISTVDSFALEQAGRDYVNWRNNPESPDDLFFSVNCSAQCMSDPDQADNVMEVLSKSNIDLSSLYLEITEEGVVANPDLTTDLMGQLKDKGVKFAMDDFGTGYSSLEYLTTLPVDQLKIDRSLVSQLESDTGEKKSRRIVRTIMNMAAGLDLDVIAEGIETQEQIQTLLDLDCTLGQGYYYAHPMESSRVDTFIENL